MWHSIIVCRYMYMYVYVWYLYVIKELRLILVSPLPVESSALTPLALHLGAACVASSVCGNTPTHRTHRVSVCGYIECVCLPHSRCQAMSPSWAS